jgi:uncharacterized protein (TIGR03086 family)
MSEIADRYRRLAAAVTDTVAAVPADGWEAPSPCEGWSARDVVGHLVDTQGLFLGFIDGSVPDGPGVDDDPLGAWTNASGAVQAALDDPVRATQTYDGFFGTTTFEAAVDRFLVFDLIVHRWDLAKATGGDETVCDEDAELVIAGAAGFGEALHSEGVCGPEVPVPAGADLQTRMLAIVGRAT